MSTKKAARKQRTEREKERQGRQRRSWLTLLALVVAGALIVLVAATIVRTRDPDRDAGLVWSPAHQHWHRR